MVDPKKVVEDAERELAEETHRIAVERHKEKLRLRKQFWIRVWPWKITIERRDQPKAQYQQSLESFAQRTSYNCNKTCPRCGFNHQYHTEGKA